MMKRFFSVVLVLGAVSGAHVLTAGAQNDRAKPGSEQQARAELQQVLKEMIDADLHGDAAALDRTTTEDYTITRDNGVVRNRKETLQGIADGTTKFESFETSDVQVRVYGDAALVSFRETIKGTRAGQDMSGQFREVRMFVKRDGKWRATFAQRTRIAS